MGRSSAYETDFCEVCSIIQGLNHVHHLHGFTDFLANHLWIRVICLCLLSFSETWAATASGRRHPDVSAGTQQPRLAATSLFNDAL